MTAPAAAVIVFTERAGHTLFVEVTAAADSPSSCSGDPTHFFGLCLPKLPTCPVELRRVAVTSSPLMTPIVDGLNPRMRNDQRELSLNEPLSGMHKEDGEQQWPISVVVPIDSFITHLGSILCRKKLLQSRDGQKENRTGSWFPSWWVKTASTSQTVRWHLCDS